MRYIPKIISGLGRIGSASRKLEDITHEARQLGSVANQLSVLDPGFQGLNYTKRLDNTLLTDTTQHTRTGRGQPNQGSDMGLLRFHPCTDAGKRMVIPDTLLRRDECVGDVQHVCLRTAEPAAEEPRSARDGRAAPRCLRRRRNLSKVPGTA
eukprot:765631-Hanusia_phi.AAC.1